MMEYILENDDPILFWPKSEWVLKFGILKEYCFCPVQWEEEKAVARQYKPDESWLVSSMLQNNMAKEIKVRVAGIIIPNCFLGNSL